MNFIFSNPPTALLLAALAFNATAVAAPVPLSELMPPDRSQGSSSERREKPEHPLGAHALID
jgi:hypothetical protein